MRRVKILLFGSCNRLKNRIQFENIPSGQRYLTSIIEAMRDNRKLKVAYQSYWSEPATFELDAYLVKIFKQRWYVIGKSDRVRIYALDRIQHLEVLADTFVMPAGFDPEAYFYKSYGIIANDDVPVEKVILKVNSDQSKYIRALPLHHSQQETETTEEYSVFEYRIKPTFDFQQEILSQGSNVEVLSPGWFRNTLKKETSEMNGLYGEML